MTRRGLSILVVLAVLAAWAAPAAAQQKVNIVFSSGPTGAVAPVMKTVTPQMMAQTLGVPLHPGAEKYYREIGAVK